LFQLVSQNASAADAEVSHQRYGTFEARELPCRAISSVRDTIMRKALFNLGIVCLFVLALVSCSRDAGDGQAVVAESAAEVQAAIAQAEAQVIAAADTYIEAWFWHFPEMATLYRIEGKSHDRLADNTRAGRAAWQAQEDKLLADLSAVDPALLEGTAAWLPYGVLLESLEASRDSRVCQDHSWNIDQVWGWQIFFGELATAQPVSTEEERAWALARWRQIPVFIDGEIENLTDGLASGFSAPRRNVSLVVEQLDSLLDMAPHESPFFGPARTADLEEFSAELEVLIAGEIYPAMQRYRDFLVDEYHDKASRPCPMGRRRCLQRATRLSSSGKGRSLLWVSAFLKPAISPRSGYS
jgi:uncharacterized protein (DUF885 family)